MSDLNQQIAKMIRFHRKKAGLSRIALAERGGVGKTAIYDLEHGKISVQLDTLLKILQVLNIQINFQSPLMEFFRKQGHAQG